MRVHPFTFWSGRRVIVTSVAGAILLPLCFFAPRFWLWPVAGLPLEEFIAIQPEFHRAFHALRQLQDPWLRIEDTVNRVIEWRLLFPLLGHAVGLSPSAYLALPFIGVVPALTAAAVFVWRGTRDARTTLAAVVLAATSSWFFVSTGWLAYFDSWLIAALLVATFARSSIALGLTALAAPWIDERFLLALPACLAARALTVDLLYPDRRATLRRDALVLALAALPYVAIRLGAEWTGTRQTASSYWSGRSLLPAPFFATLWGVWNGLRLGWVVVVLGLAAAFRLQRRGLWPAVAAMALTLLVNVVVADDISRSASVAVVALIAATLLFWRSDTVRAARLLPWLAAANLVLPAQHVIGAAGTRAEFHCVPILRLDAEIARAQQPPEFADPTAFTRRSMDHLQARLLDRALAAADIACRLNPRHAKSVANRGIVLYVRGQKAEGLAELDRALQLGPELYDARMQRAAFRQQAGNVGGALEDVRRALQDMPADWPHRSEAQKFERALAAQTGR